MTKPRLHKRQHYVPESYLQAWCDSACPPNQTPYAWFFKRDERIGFKKAPSNMFHESEFYTLKGIDGSRDLRLEKGLSSLEGLFVELRRRKIDLSRGLDMEDRVLLCAFTAAMHGRTKAQVEHLRTQWRSVLEKMKSMKRAYETGSKEQREALRRAGASASQEGGMSIRDVEEVVQHPVQTFLPLFVKVETPIYVKMDLAILKSAVTQEFITSDSPCLWFDPEGYKRPPIYQSPGLGYKSIEVTLPLSPKLTLLLNWQGLKGYQKAGEVVVDEINRRTRFMADKHFVSNRNEVKASWFDKGIPHN